MFLRKHKGALLLSILDPKATLKIVKEKMEDKGSMTKTATEIAKAVVLCLKDKIPKIKANNNQMKYIVNIFKVFFRPYCQALTL